MHGHVWIVVGRGGHHLRMIDGVDRGRCAVRVHVGVEHVDCWVCARKKIEWGDVGQRPFVYGTVSRRGGLMELPLCKLRQLGLHDSLERQCADVVDGK